MNREVRTEYSLISKFVKYLRSAKDPVPGWNNLGRVFCIGGLTLVVFCVITALQRGSDELTIAIASGLGGILAGVGMLYTTSAIQWPILKRYLNVEQLERREQELKVLLDK